MTSPIKLPPLPDGFRLVAVNQTFEDLLYWLDRCEHKGHLDNCFDLVEPWEAFEYREVEAPQPTEPVAWYTDDHLTDKSATTWDRTVAARWRDKGWPVGELFAAPQPSTEGVCKNHPQQSPVKDIPEGYKVVPIEPTEEMIEAVCTGDESQPGKSAYEVISERYKAMLEAAPTKG